MADYNSKALAQYSADRLRTKKLNTEALNTPTQLTSQQYFNNVSNPGDYQSNFFSDMTSLGFVPRVDDYAKAPTMLSNPHKAPTAHHGYNQPARQPDNTAYIDHQLKIAGRLENHDSGGISAADHLGLAQKSAYPAQGQASFESQWEMLNTNPSDFNAATGTVNSINPSTDDSKSMFSDMTGKDWLGFGLGAANLGLGAMSFYDNRKALKEQIRTSKQNRAINQERWDNAKGRTESLANATAAAAAKYRPNDNI